jgi:hypothetical protein
LDRDFAHDARRIARPIAHCGFAGKDRAFFCGLGDYVGNDENSRKKDNAGNWIAQSTSLHPSEIVRAPSIARIRIIYRKSMSYKRAIALVFFKTCDD